MEHEGVIEIEIPLMKPPSLNAYYSGGHWTKRKKAKDANLAHLKEVFKEYDFFTAKQFEIHLTYNGRYDCDNAIIAVKFLSDALVAIGIVPDDSKKYFRRMSITVNAEIPHDTYTARVVFKHVKHRD